MVTVTALVVASLLAAALLLWPARARHEVAVGLTELPRRRAELERREATTRSLRGALAADPVSAAGSGVRGVLALLRQRLGRVRVTDNEVLRLLDGLAAALSAGLPPAAALRLVADSGPAVPWLEPVLGAGEQGGLLGASWKQVAAGHQSVALEQVASAWALSERSGAALAPAVAMAAETVRRQRESRQTAQSAASGAMASMYMLSLLPLVGLAGAGALGWSPQELYLQQPLGLVSALAGVALLVVGWLASRRLVALALRGEVIR
ncbi:type II secretion system F family protein [Kytococcus sedentarius]|uniref:type II secretion system F family protein n=1 Tax=Kytococcus sedentarius TaxID=1276 RepID=UPI00384F1AF2